MRIKISGLLKTLMSTKFDVAHPAYSITKTLENVAIAPIYIDFEGLRAPSETRNEIYGQGLSSDFGLF